jgi:protease-4
MHESIQEFKEETGKPVVVSMGQTAASGGYYIATAADRIFANENTLTGSLGVIFSYLNFTEAAEEYGIEQEVVKSGPFKDIGSSTREPTEEELEILQAYVDEGYDQFVQVIVEGRGLPEEEVRELADGRVYSGQQAETLGLVDDSETSNAPPKPPENSRASKKRPWSATSDSLRASSSSSRPASLRPNPMPYKCSKPRA